MERKDLSKLFHRTAGYAISRIREAVALKEIRERLPGDYFVGKKPVFVSQLADANRNKIEGFYGKITDYEAALRFGTKDLEEFSYWSWRSCGIAALQMVLRTEFGSSFRKTTMDLIGEALEINGYDYNNDSGWYHASLLLVARNYGLDGDLLKFIPSSGIVKFIDQGKYPLASMRSKTGGHIILPYGYRIGKGGRVLGFWVNDPSTYLNDGEGLFMRKKEFDDMFTRRLIVISQK